MDRIAPKDERTVYANSELSYRIPVVATVFLIITAILRDSLIGPSIGTYQIIWFRLSLLVYVVGLGWFLWTNRRAIPPLPTAVWLLLGFSGYVAVSALWAWNTDGLLHGLFQIGSALIVAGAIYVTTANRRVVVLYLGTIIGLVAVGEVIALWEVFTGGHLWTSRLVVTEIPAHATFETFGFHVATAWFYNRNGFGFFLGLAAGPLFAWAFHSDRGLVARALAVCGLVLAVGLLWNNGSRSALAMVVLAPIGMIILSTLRPRVRARSPSRQDRWIVTAGVFGAALASVAALVFVPNPFAGVSSLSNRWQLAVEGIRILVRSNGLGVGVNSFSAANMALSGPIHGKLAPHNWLTDLLGEFGIIGTGLFLAGYARILYDVGARYVTTDDWLRLGLFGTMVSFPVGALGPANVLYTHHSLWMFFGLAAAAAYRT